MWRLSLGLGVVPALGVFIWRLNMEEPTRFRQDSMKNARIPYMLILRRYGVRLAAISCTWYLLRSVYDLDAAGLFHSSGSCMISFSKSLSRSLESADTVCSLVIRFVSCFCIEKRFFICQLP